MNDILIREWTAADIPSIRRITWETWIATYASFVPTEDLRAYFEEHYSENALAALMGDSTNDGFLSTVDAIPAGFVRTHWEAPETRFYISSLYVLPQFQGRGVGVGLMRASERTALALGVSTVWLGVMEQNIRTLQWYRRTGFSFVEKAPFTMGTSTINHLIGWKQITTDAHERSEA